jgi:uncharacterized membrane protein YhaH (DUF805 family)
MLRQLAERLNRGEINQATYQRIYNEMMAAPAQAPPRPPSPFTAPPPFAGQSIPPSPFTGQQPRVNYNPPPVYSAPEQSWYFGCEFVKAWTNIGNCGRSRRRDYWMFVLYHSIIMFVSFFFLGVVIVIAGESDEVAGVFGLMWYLFALVMYLPGIWLSIRRLHDTGNSGWWLLAPLIPVIGPIVFLVLTVQDSMPGDNQWGQNPKGIDEDDDE